MKGTASVARNERSEQLRGEIHGRSASGEGFRIFGELTNTDCIPLEVGEVIDEGLLEVEDAR